MMKHTTTVIHSITGWATSFLLRSAVFRCKSKANSLNFLACSRFPEARCPTPGSINQAPPHCPGECPEHKETQETGRPVGWFCPWDQKIHAGREQTAPRCTRFCKRACVTSSCRMPSKVPRRQLRPRKLRHPIPQPNWERVSQYQRLRLWISQVQTPECLSHGVQVSDAQLPAEHEHSTSARLGASWCTSSHEIPPCQISCGWQPTWLLARPQVSLCPNLPIEPRTRGKSTVGSAGWEHEPSAPLLRRPQAVYTLLHKRK